MERLLASELDFDKVLTLVAAHAQTRAGRQRVLGEDVLPPFSHSVHLARLTREIEHLLEDGGQLSLTGIDDGVAWLEPAIPPPAEPGDLVALLRLARRVAAVRRRLLAAPDEFELLRRFADRLPDTSDLVQWTASRIGRDGQVRDNASPELARLRRLAIRGRQQLMAQLESIQRTQPDTVTDAPPTVRRDRYCLPVRASARGNLPGLVLDSSGSGVTLFVEPYAVVELNNELVDAAARETEEVRRIVAEVAAAFAAVADDLREAAATIAELDAGQARALFGRAVGGRVVVPGQGAELILRSTRHPLLDQRLHPLRVELFGEAEQRDPSHHVVPLEFQVPDEVHTLVISGPNAGGKTVVLKTIGLTVLMAYHGIPLAADVGTSIPRFHHIWCHIGDEQNVAADLSTFSAAMNATADLLGHATDDTLVLYDELGTGTDPLEGAALGCALLEELTRRQALTVTSTHLAAIAMAASAAEGMDNAAMEYDEERQRSLYTLHVGRPGRSRGLEIAGAMGVAPAIIDRARDLLGGQHLELDRWLRRLESMEAELELEREALARQIFDSEQIRRQLATEIDQLTSERQRLPEQLASERERLRRRAKDQLDRALAALDEATRDRKPIGRKLRRKLRDDALDLPVPDPRVASNAPAELQPGERVAVHQLGGEGVLQEVRGSQALVTVGGKRLWVPRADVSALSGPQQTRQAAAVRIEVRAAAPRELVLLGMDSEGAREELERYLDRALASGQPTVRIVHGHGTGTLRRMVRDTCRTHPAVGSFRHPPQHLGGSGATEIRLVGGGGDEL